MRATRSELLSLCKHRMENTNDDSNVDTLVLLLHKLRRACVDRSKVVARNLLPYCSLLHECIRALAENVHLSAGHSGSAKIIYDQFSGRAGSVLQRRIAKLFDDTKLTGASAKSGGSSRDSRDGGSAGGGGSASGGGGSGGSGSGGGGRSGGGGGGYSRNQGARGQHPNPPSFDPAVDTCFRCGVVGHIGKNCALYQPPRNAPPRNARY